MKTTINKYEFRDAFAGRANFSYEALGLLFDYFDDDDEFDMIAICCDFSESTHAEVIVRYGLECDPVEYLQEHTIFIGETSDNTLVYANF